MSDSGKSDCLSVGPGFDFDFGGAFLPTFFRSWSAFFRSCSAFFRSCAAFLLSRSAFFSRAFFEEGAAFFSAALRAFSARFSASWALFSAASTRFSAAARRRSTIASTFFSRESWSKGAGGACGAAPTPSLTSVRPSGIWKEAPLSVVKKNGAIPPNVAGLLILGVTS